MPTEKKRICVLHHDLTLYCDIKEKGLLNDPTDITTLNGRYFVTVESAIVVLKIDFQKRSFEAHKIEKMVMAGGCTESFSDELELRGICACSQYLYVAEASGRLLCLQYNPTGYKLNYIGAVPDCSPIAVAHYNGEVYFSQTTREGCFIAKVTHTQSTMAYDTLFRI